MNVVTLTQCYYPNKAALDAAIARETQEGRYRWAAVWELRKPASPACEGLITRFRSMLINSGRLPYQGYAVVFYRSGLTWQVAKQVGLDYDALSDVQQDAVMDSVQAQRKHWNAVAYDVSSTLVPLCAR